jgi:hypothetical protein
MVHRDASYRAQDGLCVGCLDDGGDRSSATAFSQPLSARGDSNRTGVVLEVY